MTKLLASFVLAAGLVLAQTGGGFSGNADSIRGSVVAPRVISKVEPQYSDEALKAKYQGEVWLSVTVDEKGSPQQITVTRKLGLGLDEKAIEAVKQWRFQPGIKDGQPVSVKVTIALTFRLPENPPAAPAPKQ